MSEEANGVILIVGQRGDLHVQTICAKVQQLGAECHVLDEDMIRFRLSYVASQLTVEARVDGSWIALETARSVWWWRKETTLAFSRADDFVGDFVMRERRELLESLEALLPKANWPIPPSAVRGGSLKCQQLALAQDLGFRIPRTIITNDAESVAQFIDANRSAFLDDRLMYKPLTWYVGPPNRFLFATLVSALDVEAASSAVSAAPSQYQEYVDKCFEVRATVVGDCCFSVRINSQQSVRGSIDYRRDQDGIEYESCQLPSQVTQMLLQFLKRSNLRYGAFDLIVTPDDEVVFLELNPVGQWLWLEHKTGVDISGAVAALLVG